MNAPCLVHESGWRSHPAHSGVTVMSCDPLVLHKTSDLARFLVYKLYMNSRTSIMCNMVVVL